MSETIFANLPHSESCDDLRALSGSVSAASGLPLDFMYRGASQAGTSASAMFVAPEPQLPTYNFQYALRKRSVASKGECLQWWKVLTPEQKQKCVQEARANEQACARACFEEALRNAAIREKLKDPSYLENLRYECNVLWAELHRLSEEEQRLSEAYRAAPAENCFQKITQAFARLESTRATLNKKDGELQLAYKLKMDVTIAAINARDKGDEEAGAHFKAPEDC